MTTRRFLQLVVMEHRFTKRIFALLRDYNTQDAE
jgi:hypothetical protein